MIFAKYLVSRKVERWKELRSEGQRVIRISKFAFGRATQELRAFWDETEKRENIVE